MADVNPEPAWLKYQRRTTALLQEFAEKKQERYMKAAQKAIEKAVSLDPERKD